MPVVPAAEATAPNTSMAYDLPEVTEKVIEVLTPVLLSVVDSTDD